MFRVSFWDQIFFPLSFTNLMRVLWGIHLGRCPKLGPGGSSQEGQISAACAFWSPSPRLERDWFPKLGLWRHHLGADELTGQPGPCGWDWGKACFLGFTPFCWALPVSWQHWVLLLRVVLRAFVADSWAWPGCFLMCNTHSCYLLTSSTVLGKTLDSPCLIYLKCEAIEP